AQRRDRAHAGPAARRARLRLRGAGRRARPADPARAGPLPRGARALAAEAPRAARAGGRAAGHGERQGPEARAARADRRAAPARGEVGMKIGVGVGWLAEEFQAAGIEFRTRAARTRECVRALRALWTEAAPEFHGRFFSFGPVKFEPKPVQKPHPPIVFGGETEAALRRATALGDGWYGVGHTPESAAVQAGRLRALLAAAGREGAPFELTVSHAGSAL